MRRINLLRLCLNKMKKCSQKLQLLLSKKLKIKNSKVKKHLNQMFLIITMQQQDKKLMKRKKKKLFQIHQQINHWTLKLSQKVYTLLVQSQMLMLKLKLPNQSKIQLLRQLLKKKKKKPRFQKIRKSSTRPHL